MKSQNGSPPPDRPQDDQPPDLDLLLAALAKLLHDVRLRFDPGDDLNLRCQALHTAIIRIIHDRRV